MDSRARARDAGPHQAGAKTSYVLMNCSPRDGTNVAGVTAHTNDRHANSACCALNAKPGRSMAKKKAAQFELELTADAPFESWAPSWNDLRRQFEYSRAELMSIRWETEEEGKARADREVRETTTRRDREEAGVVRFANEQDIKDVQDYLRAARELIPHLEAMLRTEILTLDFLATWGSFQLSYGLAMASCFRSADAFDAYRKAIRASLEKQVASALKRKFVAVLLKAKLDAGGTGKTIYRDVAVQISDFIKAADFTNFDQEWFKSLLDPTKGILRPTYNERHLLKPEIEALAALPRDDIPSI